MKMTYKKLLDCIEKGENLTVEFKQRFSTSEKIAKEIIAFANTRGGIIIFGVNDNGSICGVDSEKGTTELVKQTIDDYCEPPPEVEYFYFQFSNKETVTVKILESHSKPLRLQDYKKQLDLNTAKVYIRVNDKSVPASKEMIKLLQSQSTNKKLTSYEIGGNEKRVFELLDKYENVTVKQLSEFANISNRRASRTLIKLVRANVLLIHTKENGENYFTYSGREIDCS